jgi:seryl-tRNA synthetase
MPDHELDAAAYASFRDELFAAGLLFGTGVDGVYARSATYERVVDGLHRLIGRTMVEPDAERIHFPPVLARPTFDKTEYLKSFPQLMGSVQTFRGTDRQHAELIARYESGDDWSELLVAADVVLCSATCHPIYPLCTGTLPDGGRHFEVYGYCFRCEPSVDPTRMQAFRMQESVYVGTPSDAEGHSKAGLERGLELLSGLGLAVDHVVANDPFFGRLGTMLAANQHEEGLKIEVVTPIASSERPTAIMSANYARDHFGAPFAIETADGEVAHSACVAFGVDRVTLALLHTHGLDPETWPSSVRDQLWS